LKETTHQLIIVKPALFILLCFVSYFTGVLFTDIVPLFKILHIFFFCYNDKSLFPSNDKTTNPPDFGHYRLLDLSKTLLDVCHLSGAARFG